jgi:hypothetical protein
MRNRKYGPVIQATLAGIEQAGKGIPPELEWEALSFFKEYAESHLYFNGGTVLAAWRKRVGSNDSDCNWRNRWGAITVKARTAGWIRKVGRERPKSRQSHTLSLVKWQSLIYQGDEKPEPQAWDYLKQLRKQNYCREIDVMDALWKAYEAGVEQSGVDESFDKNI